MMQEETVDIREYTGKPYHKNEIKIGLVFIDRLSGLKYRVFGFNEGGWKPRAKRLEPPTKEEQAQLTEVGIDAPLTFTAHEDYIHTCKWIEQRPYRPRQRKNMTKGELVS